MARHCFEKALQCDPELLIVRCSLAYLFCSRGEYATALELYDKVLDIDSNYEAAVAGKASVLERTGDTEAAFGLVQPLIERGTENIHTLFAYAQSCSVAGKESTAASLLEHALAGPGLLPDDRKHACFMLGKLFDRLGRYDEAFLSYRRGNALNRFPFDRDAHLRFVDSVLAVFSAENMDVLPRSTNQSGKPVFIVGMPRSGTSLTEQILASHPEVFGAGELSHVRNIATGIAEASGCQQPFPLGIPSIGRELLDRLSVQHLHALETLADDQQVIIDKMPSNFMFLGLIELLFPNARILHCVRDPLDTCLSCYFQNFSSGQFFSYNQSDLAFYYNQYRRLMTHWKSTLRIPTMDIHYEQLVEDPEGTSKRMVEFIGLQWHAGCLDFHKAERNIRTASYDQVRKPVYGSSVRRWKRYEGHLAELRSALCE
jgi:hypothetical protein